MAAVSGKAPVHRRRPKPLFQSRLGTHQILRLRHRRQDPARNTDLEIVRKRLPCKTFFGARCQASGPHSHWRCLTGSGSCGRRPAGEYAGGSQEFPFPISAHRLTFKPSHLRESRASSLSCASAPGFFRPPAQAFDRGSAEHDREVVRADIGQTLDAHQPEAAIMEKMIERPAQSRNPRRGVERSRVRPRDPADRFSAGTARVVRDHATSFRSPRQWREEDRASPRRAIIRVPPSRQRCPHKGPAAPVDGINANILAFRNRTLARTEGTLSNTRNRISDHSEEAGTGRAFRKHVVAPGHSTREAIRISNALGPLPTRGRLR